jgi:hypothetical protein
MESMKSTLVSLGVALMLIGVFFTVITFGFGFICFWPLIVVGFIIFLIGLLMPEEGRPIVHHVSPETAPRTGRYCTNCGREIPFDANVCPYCGKNFKSE